MAATQQSAKATFTNDQVAGAVQESNVAIQRDKGATKVSTGNKAFDKALVSLGKELVAGKIKIEGVIKNNIVAVQEHIVALKNEFGLTADMLKSNQPARVLLQDTLRSVAAQKEVLLSDKTITNYISAISMWLKSDGVQPVDLYGNAKRLGAAKQRTAQTPTGDADKKASSEGTGAPATDAKAKVVTNEQRPKLTGILPLQQFIVAWLQENEEVAGRNKTLAHIHAMLKDVSDACAKELPQNTAKFVPADKK